jgi:nicotinamide phosphoribosyltransferase
MLGDIRKNPIMLTDVYNLSHERLKVNTDFEVSHMYNRANPMILYGLKEIVNSILSKKITMSMVNKADKLAEQRGLSFPKELWKRVVTECNGRIPIKIEMLPEGTYCPINTPFAQIRNTVKGFGEMVTWLEAILMHGWFPSACATEAFNMKKYLVERQNQFGYDDGFLWKFHSFGFRGHKSLEDSYFAGTAWSLFLQGTDDFHVFQHMPNGVMGSISALAHKVTQQFDDEYECFIHTIDATKEVGEGIVAMVIDTYNAWNVINKWVTPLTEYAKSKGVKVVWRPDSGDIFDQTVAIYKIAKENDLLNSCAVIVGEGMSFEEAKKFDSKLLDYDVPINFVNYGIGAGFYKNLERDTLGWAMKTAFSNGQPRMKLVPTEPIKQSIPNIVHLTYNNGDMVVQDGDGEGLYEVIYEYIPSGNEAYIATVNSRHFDEVRSRAYAQKTTQEKILLSKETQALINSFHEKYDIK